ncbi:MAG: glycosyltransferase family 2 protein [Solirubrobacteraceae bacterium]
MLSFLVPAYNSADVVGAAVASALAQRLDEPFEVVAVDDASTDATGEVLDRLAAEDERLRVHHHEVNGGGGAARNTAARLARGELLYVLDADNLLDTGTAQAVLSHQRATGAAAVSPEIQRFFDGTTGKERHTWTMSAVDGRSTLMHALTEVGVPAAHGNYLYTRELFDAVGGYEDDLGAMDTWTFGFKHLAHGYDVAIAPGAGYRHRLERPSHDSYWTRRQKEGANERDALVGIGRQLDRLPPAIREKLGSVVPGDPFFAIVEAGLFADDVSLDAFAAGLARLREEPPAEPARPSVRARIGALLGR